VEWKYGSTHFESLYRMEVAPAALLPRKYPILQIVYEDGWTRE
jgi:hypothetical protein